MPVPVDCNGCGKTFSSTQYFHQHLSAKVECADAFVDRAPVGKGLSGGYLPISATLTTEKIYSAFLGDFEEKKTLYHGHTFAGNPLAAAVSIANLDVFRNEKTLENVQPKIQQIQTRINGLAEFDEVLNPRSLGMVAAFDLQVPESQNATSWGYDFCQKVQERGVRIRPLGNTIIIMPPLAIEESELAMIFDSIEFVLREMV